MGRTWAIIERELRRFRRSPVLIVMALFMPIVQLVILGYAFGGNVKHLKLAIVDQDHGVPAVRVRELASAAASGAHTIDIIDYADQGQAIDDLRNGRVNGVLTIPPDFSRRVLAKNEPHVALIEDNTDGFVSVALAGTMGGILQAYSLPAHTPRIGGSAALDVVEIYPYVPYIQYLLPGSVVMSIFMMVMIGGGIIFIDDKARGLHEGYLVTPIKKLELIAGFNISGTIKAVIAGMFLMIIGSVIAGIPNAFDPMRLLRLFVVVCVTAFALISLMFLLMVRVSDPLLPRMVFGVLNTVLYFPSGAVYPQQGFPAWMQVIAVADPFTYAVHAFKSLLLKNTGFARDLLRPHVPADLLGRVARRGDGPVQAVAVTIPPRHGDARPAAEGGRAAVRRSRLQEGDGPRHLPRRARQRRRGQLSLRRQARALPRGAAVGDRRDARHQRRRPRGRRGRSRRRSSCAATSPSSCTAC